jgi:hypothetical protein
MSRLTRFLFEKGLIPYRWMIKSVNAELRLAPRKETITSYRMAYDDIAPPALEFYSDPCPFLSLCGEKSLDYVRYRLLELMREQIEGVPGNVAELGVFTGDFARMINYLFPQKRLFLYDTFTGFDARDSS